MHVPPPWHSGMTRILGRQKLHVTGTLCQMYCTKVYHSIVILCTRYFIADSLHQVYHPTFTLAQWHDAHIGPTEIACNRYIVPNVLYQVYHDGYIVIVPNTLYIIADSLHQVYHPTITLAQWDDAHIGQKANRGVITTRSHVFTARNRQ